MAHRGPDRRGSGPGRRGREGRDGREDRHARREAGAGPGLVPFVARPFEGLAGETEWVALREFVPAATGTVALAAAPAAAGDTAAARPTEVHVASVLPLAHPAVVRADRSIWLAVQTLAAGASGDASRELADALERALATEPGTHVHLPERLTPGMRLQDLLDPASPLHLTVAPDLAFWLDDDGGSGLDGAAADVRASMDRATQSLAPTERILGSESAYRTEIGRRTYIRWVLAGAEDRSLDALARLHAAGAVGVTPGSRLLGSFRACGLIVPVWEIDPATTVEELVEPLGRVAADLADARTRGVPLTDAERRSRAGLLSRQITVH